MSRDAEHQATLAIILTAVASVRKRIVSFTDLLPVNRRPGAYPHLEFFTPSQMEQLLTYSFLSYAIQHVRSEVGFAVDRNKQLNYPVSTPNGCVAKFGIGRCGEMTLEVIFELNRKKFLGSYLQIVIAKQDNINCNHTFIVYTPPWLHNSISIPKSGDSAITWLNQIDSKILNQLILIDVWRNLVMTLSPNQKKQFVETMRKAKMFYVDAAQLILLSEATHNLMPKIHTEIDLLYNSVEAKLSQYQNKFDGLRQKTDEADAELFAADETRRVDNTMALAQLFLHSGFKFFGVPRPDYTLDAVAEIKPAQFTTANNLIEKLAGAGEIHSHAEKYFLLFRGVNVSECTCRPDDGADALLRKIQAL